MISVPSVNTSKRYFRTEDQQAAILDEWVDLKLMVHCRRTETPQEVYKSLLAARPVSIKNVLLLVEIINGHLVPHQQQQWNGASVL